MEILKTDINRIFMISDLHFGVRNNSVEWLDIHKDYFQNFFIPFIKKNKKENDVLFILGDIFESRQTINILVLNETIKIIQEISQILPVYIIVGNHDSYKRMTSDINSAIVFRNINNVKVFDEPCIIEASDKKLLMMPWLESKEDELNCIRENTADYLFCHTDFQGIKFNKKTLIEEGLDVESVSKFKAVYSGHIHLTQKHKNVTMVGCIFPLTRNDISDTKKVFVLDLNTGKDAFVENNYSPKFLKYNLDKLLNLSFEEFEKQIKNNFVDIIIENDWITSFPFSQLMDSVSGYRKINYVLSSLQKDYEEFDEEILDNEMNIEDLTEFYINELDYSDDFKKMLLEASTKFYQKAKKFMEEKTFEED